MLKVRFNLRIVLAIFIILILKRWKLKCKMSEESSIGSGQQLIS